MYYYLKIEDFEILLMFGDWAINVINSKVKWIIMKFGDEKI